MLSLIKTILIIINRHLQPTRLQISSKHTIKARYNINAKFRTPPFKYHKYIIFIAMNHGNHLPNLKIDRTKKALVNWCLFNLP